MEMSRVATKFVPRLLNATPEGLSSRNHLEQCGNNLEFHKNIITDELWVYNYASETKASQWKTTKERSKKARQNNYYKNII